MQVGTVILQPEVYLFMVDCNHASKPVKYDRVLATLTAQILLDLSELIIDLLLNALSKCGLLLLCVPVIAVFLIDQLLDLKAGSIRAVLVIPHDFSHIFRIPLSVFSGDGIVIPVGTC